MNRHVVSLVTMQLPLLILLIGCAAYRSVITESGDYNEINKAEVLKRDIKPGDEISMVVSGIKYTDIIVAKLDDEVIIVVNNPPQSKRNNYRSFRYEEIDSLLAKGHPYHDEFGIPFTLVLIVFYLLV